MKKFFSFLTLGLLLVVFGCVKEKDSGQPEEPMTMVEVPVDIGEAGYSGADTKSLISIEAERFQKGALFAFDGNTHKVLLYQGSPIVKTTESKTFSWSLPVNVKMNIYIIANYADLDLSGYLANTSLTESDLQALTFSCANGTQLKQLEQEGYGLPMAGIKWDVTLTPNNTSLSLKVKKLFARYDFYFNASALIDAGYSVHSLYISASKSNTEVPYFVEGYKQTNVSKLNVVDLGTPEDIEELNYGSASHAITLYFLENCQGDKAGAAHWYDVASANLPGINLCSYIDLGIKTTDADGYDSNFFYWIYLGDDCTTNFDVRRNEYRTIKLRLQTPDVVPPTQGIKIIPDYSVFASTLPGGCRLYFETSLSQAEVTARSSSDQLTTSISGFNNGNEHDVTGYPHSGYVDIAPVGAHDMTAAISSTVTVGKWESNSWKVSDQHEVNLAGEELYITMSENSKSWAWDSYGSGSVQVAKVSTNIARASLSVNSNNNANVYYMLATTPNGDGTYNLSMYWKSSNSSSSDRTATVTVSGSGKSGTAQMRQYAKPEDEITYRISSMSLSKSTLDFGETSTATVYRQKYVNGVASGSPESVSNSNFNWSSSNTSRATVSKGTITASSSNEGSATITATLKTAAADYASYENGHKSTTANVTVSHEPVITYRLGVYPTSMTLEEGESSSVPTLYKEKYVDGYYESRTTYSGSASWSVTSGSTYASVNNSTGVVTARSNGSGSANVRATVTDSSFDSGYRTANISVTVNEKEDVITYRISSMSLSKSTLDFNQTSTATVYRQKYVNGVASGSPESVGNSNFNWSSSNTSYATVSGGTITASSSNQGSSTITATLKSTATDYSSYESSYRSASASVTVSHEPVITYELQLSGNSSAMVGNNIQLTATYVTYTDGELTAQSNVTSSATYTRQSGSSNVSVNSSGSVSAVNPGGTAMIRASYSGKTADHSVTFNMNSGFEWITANNQSVDEGNTITLEFWSSTNSVSITSNNSKLSVGTPSYTSQSGTTNAWAYRGSVVLTAGDVDDDITVTITGPGSKTRTINVIAQWNVGFEWASSSDIDLTAGSNTNATYYCSSANPSLTGSSGVLEVTNLGASETKSNNWRYSGTARISAAANTPNGTTATVTGSASGHSASRTVNVSNNTTSYALVLAAVGSTSGVFGSYIPIKAYFKTYTGGIETASNDVTMAASYSGPSELTINKNGQNLEARISSSAAGTYTVTGTFTPSAQLGELSGSISLTFNDLIEYDLRIEESAHSTEVGNSITLTAYYDTYINNVKTNSQNVTSSCTWGKSGTGSSYVSVSGGVVTATKSCTYASVGSYTITCSYSAAGKSKNHSVVFNPHVTQVSYYWKGIREVDHTTYKVRIKTSCNLPCNVTFTHNGGPSYAGYGGMVVSSGSSESSEYIFSGYLPALNGAGDPGYYYVTSEDTRYEFHTVGSSDITYL